MKCINYRIIIEALHLGYVGETNSIEGEVFKVLGLNRRWQEF